MLALLLIAGCGDKGSGGGGGDYVWPGCDVAATLTVDEDPPISGDVPLTVTLTSPGGDPATVDLKYSLDGQTWQEAAFEAPSGDLATSEAGATHALTWRSLADLGEGWFEGVALKAVPSIACGPGQSAIVEGLTVENAGDAVPRCQIDLPPLVSPQDGPVTLTFTLTHAGSASADVQARYRLSGEDAQPATLSLVDCDGDGAADEGRSLATSPEGVQHCLVWDSQQDLTLDGEAVIELDCAVGNEVEDTAQSATFSLENDPTPGKGEVIFSELMLDSDQVDGEYIELQNATNHTLNLHGLELTRCHALFSSEIVCVTFLLEDSSKTLLLTPEDPLLLAATDDREDNGCIDPDLEWGDDFSARDESDYSLAYGGESLAELAVYADDGWKLSRGVALGLSSARVGSTAWSKPASWCDQTEPIPACEEAKFTELGTPGVANGQCP